jgi:hypothetical protein
LYDIRGEHTSDAAKFDRMVSSYDTTDDTESIMGCRMDLILKGEIGREKEIPKYIELGTIEIKHSTVSDKEEAIQLNKNIRVNKSIMRQLAGHVSENNNLAVIGMDIVGMNGFFYHLKLYESTVVAIKASESSLFLLDSEDDIEDFVGSTSLEQLLNFKVSKLKLIFFIILT